MNTDIQVVRRETHLEEVISLLPLLVLGGEIIRALNHFFRGFDYIPHLWIESPKGKNYKLPYKQAIRIVRKHPGWRFPQTEPVKNHLTRWQHFKAIFSKEELF
jgi:hypothetical protein